MGKQAVEAPRSNIFMVDPSTLTVITDPSHPLYDPRVDLPVAETLVDSICDLGVLKPLLVRKDGGTMEVIDGRQRTRAAVAANGRRKAEGGEPILVPVRVLRVEDGELGNIVYAANINVADPPMMRARKVSHALTVRGMSKAQLALAMGVTTQTIDNCLALLDCSPKVQSAVEKGQLKESTARQFKDMPREKQDALLDGMVTRGLTKGNAAKSAIIKAKRGKDIGTAKPRHRMMNAILLEEWLDQTHSVLHDGEIVSLVVPVMRAILGDPKALGELPTDLRATYEAARENLKAKQ